MDRSEALRNKIAYFLDCELNCNSGLLTISNSPQHLEPRVFQFLLLLIEQQGKIVSKQKVIDRLWGDKKSSDEALRAMVKKTREALNDNARNPIYIKTIPTKGYLLIPSVELQSTVAKGFLRKHLKMVVAVFAIVALIAFILSWWFTNTNNDVATEQPIILKEEKIVELNADRVNAHYLNNALYNISLIGSSVEQFSHIILNNLDEKRVREVAFIDNFSPNFHIAPLSNKILVMRNDYRSIFTIDAIDKDSAINVLEIETPWLPEVDVLAVNNTGRILFILSPNNPDLNLVTVNTGDEVNSTSINYLNDYLAKQEILVSSEKLKVWPSPATEHFIVTIDDNKETHLILFADIDAEKPLTELKLNDSFDALVWSEDGLRFSFLTKNQNLKSFQLESLRLTSWNTGKPISGELVADCGGSCFIFSSIEGEDKAFKMVNPFVSSMSANTSVQTQVFTHIELNNEDTFVAFNSGNSYYLHQSSQGIHLIRFSKNGDRQVLYKFALNASVDKLALSPSGQYIAGLLDQRPFMLDISASRLDYLQLGFPVVNRFYFANENELNFTVPMQTENKQGAVYRYYQQTRQVDLLQENAKQVIETQVSTTTSDNQTTRLQAKLVFTNDNTFYVEFSNNVPTKILENITLECEDCWQVNGSYIYSLQAGENSKLWSLQRTNFLSGESESRPIFASDLTGKFTMQANQNEIMVIRRPNSDAILVKIEGMQQVY